MTTPKADPPIPLVLRCKARDLLQRLEELDEPIPYRLTEAGERRCEEVERDRKA